MSHDQNNCYSLGIAPYYDLFDEPEARHPGADFCKPFVFPGCAVLDIGAGTGSLSLGLAAQGAQVFALEPDAEMFSVLLSGLMRHPEFHEQISPVHQAIGLRLPVQLDLCTCFAVLHLLEETQQERVLQYAKTQLRAGGKLILSIPIVSEQRANRPWTLSASRRLGRVLIEKHTATALEDESHWTTSWKFVSSIDGVPVREVSRNFRWKPMTHERSQILLQANGFEIVNEYSGFDCSTYRPGQSPTRIVVARIG